jgi:hypothetical protein
MRSARFDFSQWPVLGLYVPSTLEDDTLAATFEEWERICRDRGPHLAALDMRDFDPLHALGPIRHIAAREVSKGLSTYEGTLLGVVRLVSHPLTTALLSAFDWLVPLSWEVCNTHSARVGERWLREQGAAARLEVPASLDLDAQRTRERKGRGGVDLAS